MTPFDLSFTPGQLSELRSAVAALLFAFVLSHVYVFTHRGLSFSQTFVQTLVMGGVVTAMMMLTIGNNIVWGIGVMGALALVRFRTNLRDSRDMIFVFASLVCGIACGTRAFALAALSCGLFSAIAVYLAWFPFAARRNFDGLLRFTAQWTGDTVTEATAALKRHCKQFVLATIREIGQGSGSEHVYHVNFRRGVDRESLARELTAIAGLSGVELLMEDLRQEP